MSLRRTAILLVRATGPDILDPETGAIIASGYPSVPAAWEVVQQDTWSELRAPSGRVFHAYRLNTWQPDVTQGVFLVVQREPDGAMGLSAIAGKAGVTYAGRLRATWVAARAVPGIERQVLRHLPSWRVTGTEVDPEGGPDLTVTRERRRLLSDGQRLPANWFTGSGPWTRGGLTVTARHRPALGAEVFGYDDVTPEDGTPED